MSAAADGLPLRDVRTVAEALAEADTGPVTLGGRILAVAASGSEVLLGDASGEVPLRWPGTLPHPEPGELWLLRVARGEVPASLEVLGGRRVGGPRGAFPRPDGAWTWLQAQGRRRAHWLARRAEVLERTRAFFRVRGYLEVDTPVGVYSPGVEPHLQAYALRDAGPGEPRWLRTSPEYEMKRLLAGGMPRIFQLGPVFRREEHGDWHEPEFAMLEWYRAFCDMEALLEETESLVAELAEATAGRPVLRTPVGEVDVTPPWPRMSVEEAFERHARADLWNVLPDETRFFELFVERIQPALGRERAVFLVDWPASMASLARLKPGDARVAERFEAFAGGVELCNGFGELVDPAEQRRRFAREVAERARLGLTEHPVCERFLGALEEGLPPSAGNALGFDRLLALLLGAPRLADVRAVPAERLDPPDG